MEPSKKQRTEEESDEAIVEALEKIQELQEDMDKLNEEASDEILKVEEKFIKKRRPLYTQRSELIAKVPKFWPTVLSNHAELSGLISDEDQEVLDYLTDVDVEDFPEVRLGYTITMTFKENPFFENKELKKTYRFEDDSKVNITGTEIRWQPGRSLTALKEQNGEGGDDKKRRRDEDEQQSFFKWFFTPDEETVAMLGEDPIAEVLREDVWPNALKIYTQDPDEGEEGDEDEEEEGEEGEEGDEGDEEEEEEDAEGGNE